MFAECQALSRLRAMFEEGARVGMEGDDKDVEVPSIKEVVHFAFAEHGK